MNILKIYLEVDLVVGQEGIKPSYCCQALEAPLTLAFFCYDYLNIEKQKQGL